MTIAAELQQLYDFATKSRRVQETDDYEFIHEMMDKLTDGFYFARRCLAILNMKDECLLNTESEKESFIRMLNSNFVNTWEKVS